MNHRKITNTAINEGVDESEQGTEMENDEIDEESTALESDKTDKKISIKRSDNTIVGKIKVFFKAGGLP